jgi:hypothetical protein
MVFAAINKSQSIRLFEKDKDFELCIEDDNTFTGTYFISLDTVFLSYRHGSSSALILPKKLFINKSASNIQSTDGESFSAEIYLDTRQKSYNAAKNTIRKKTAQEEPIYAIGAQK